MLFSRLVFNQNFVIGEGNFRAIEWYVKGVVSLLNLSWDQAAVEVSAPDEQRLAVNGMASDDSVGWDVAARAGHPVDVAEAQELVLGFGVLLPSVANVGLLLVRHYLGRQLVALVEGAANVNWRVIDVEAGLDGAGRDRLVDGRGNPLTCNEGI